MNKKDRKKVYTKFLVEQTKLAEKTIDLSLLKPDKAEEPPQYGVRETKITKTIKNGGFGCKEGAVHELMCIIHNKPLPPLESIKEPSSLHTINGDELSAISWACYTHPHDDNDGFDDTSGFTTLIVPFSKKDELITIIADDGINLWCSDDYHVYDINFATQKEIKDLIEDSDVFEVLDRMLKHLI